MQTMSRWLHVVLLLCILLALLASTAVYLYSSTSSFHQFVQQDVRILSPFFEKSLGYYNQYQINPRWGIVTVIVATLCYFSSMVLSFFKTVKFRVPSNFIAFFASLILALSVGVICIIYYWPDDIIRFGNFFELRRGKREVFADNLIHIGLLVFVAHLFLFLLAAISRLVIANTKSNKVKK